MNATILSDRKPDSGPGSSALAVLTGEEDLSDYSSLAVQKGLAFLQMQADDINPESLSLKDYTRPNEPIDFAQLRFDSAQRSIQSNKKSLIKYLQKEKHDEKHTELLRHHTTSTTPGVHGIVEELDVNQKIQQAHEHLKESKKKVKERALKKFKVERALELSKKKCLENAARHTNLVHLMNLNRTNRIATHRKQEAEKKMADTVRREKLDALLYEKARKLHEQDTLERRAREEKKRATHKEEVEWMQETRREFANKMAQQKEDKIKEEREDSDKKRQIALKRMEDVETMKRKEYEHHEQQRMLNIQQRKKDREYKQALLERREQERLVVLQQQQAARMATIKKHQLKKEQNKVLQQQKVDLKEEKIRSIHLQRKKLMLEHEEKMLHLVREGNAGHNEFKIKKAQEAKREALTQQLYRQEVLLKVERQKLLDEQNAVVIKERILIKEKRNKEMEEKRRIMMVARQQMEKETLMFKKKIRDGVDECVRTSNWDLHHQHHLFGKEEERNRKEEEENQNKTTKKHFKRKKKIDTSPSPRLGVQKHNIRWVAGHSEHEHLFHHLSVHDGGCLDIIGGGGGDGGGDGGGSGGETVSKPVRPSERLGASHHHRNAGVLSSKRRSSRKTSPRKTKHKMVAAKKNKQSSPYNAKVELPTSKEQLIW